MGHCQTTITSHLWYAMVHFLLDFAPRRCNGAVVLVILHIARLDWLFYLSTQALELGLGSQTWLHKHTVTLDAATWVLQHICALVLGGRIRFCGLPPSRTLSNGRAMLGPTRDSKEQNEQAKQCQPMLQPKRPRSAFASRMNSQES